MGIGPLHQKQSTSTRARVAEEQESTRAGLDLRGPPGVARLKYKYQIKLRTYRDE